MLVQPSVFDIHNDGKSQYSTNGNILLSVLIHIRGHIWNQKLL